MKKSFQKILKASVKKSKSVIKDLRKSRFADFREDFVITAQEEKEGGFFGGLPYKFAHT